MTAAHATSIEVQAPFPASHDPHMACGYMWAIIDTSASSK